MKYKFPNTKPATLQMSFKSSITAEVTVFQKAVFLDVILKATMSGNMQPTTG